MLCTTKAAQPACTGVQAIPGLLAERTRSGNGPWFVSGILSGAEYSKQTALWWVNRRSASPSHSRPRHGWSVTRQSPSCPTPAPNPNHPLCSWQGGARTEGRDQGGGPARLPPGDPPFPWPSGGSSTRSPTTAAACTWWRGASSAASRTGRPTARACSRSAGCSTSSSPSWVRAAHGGNKDPESGVLAGLGVLSGPLTGC